MCFSVVLVEKTKQKTKTKTKTKKKQHTNPFFARHVTVNTHIFGLNVILNITLLGWLIRIVFYSFDTFTRCLSWGLWNNQYPAPPVFQTFSQREARMSIMTSLPGTSYTGMLSASVDSYFFTAFTAVIKHLEEQTDAPQRSLCDTIQSPSVAQYSVLSCSFARLLNVLSFVVVDKPEFSAIWSLSSRYTTRVLSEIRGQV